MEEHQNVFVLREIYKQQKKTYTYLQVDPWSRQEPRRTFPNAPGSYNTAAPTVEKPETTVNTTSNSGN